MQAIIEELSAQIKQAEDIRKYVLAGNATFTLRSTKTGKRYTYKVRKVERGDLHLVSLMTGPDNEGDFTYLGVINLRSEFQATVKSHHLRRSESFIAFDFFWNRAVRERAIPSALEFWHSGRCGRCGRRLTVPESIERGIGPECAGKI